MIYLRAIPRPITTATCLSAVFAMSCMRAPQPAKSAQDDRDDPPELDIQNPWTDPVADYPKPKRWKETPRSALQNPQAPRIVIRNATVHTATHKALKNATVVTEGGKIVYVGTAPPAVTKGSRIIDAQDKHVTPGLIDTHSHLGVYPSPSTSAHADGNEMSAPVTPQVKAGHGYWPQDPGIGRALAGGVTTAQILPGSANLVGGHGAIVVMKHGRSIADVRFPHSPRTMKMACGENPKRVYGAKGGPQTRMGEYAAFRTAFREAAEYRAKIAAYNRERTLWLRKRERAQELEREAKDRGKDARIPAEPAPTPPPHNANLAALAAVLDGQILVQLHCYRADDIRQMVTIADEFGFTIRSIHHALEAYKIRDLLVARGISISTWADWWGFKLEAFDGIPENAALFTTAGGRAIIHSDSEVLIQRLNQEAGKAYYAGRHAGLAIHEHEALRWITANAAWALGIDDVTGTLEKGKRADVVLWNKHPFSVYATAELVLQGGVVAFERSTGRSPSDFELGNSAMQETN